MNKLGEGWTPENRQRKLHEYLPLGRKKRRKHHGRKVHSSKIPNRVSIHHRPVQVDARSVFGHWEGDSVLGAKSVADGIHTEVERHTRLLRGTDFSQVSEKELQAAITEINNQPRKCLSWITPAEAFHEQLHLETTDQCCTSE